jgi:hypothetical protein
MMKGLLDFLTGDTDDAKVVGVQIKGTFRLKDTFLSLPPFPLLHSPLPSLSLLSPSSTPQTILDVAKQGNFSDGSGERSQATHSSPAHFSFCTYCEVSLA